MQLLYLFDCFSSLHLSLLLLVGITIFSKLTLQFFLSSLTPLSPPKPDIELVFIITNNFILVQGKTGPQHLYLSPETSLTKADKQFWT